MPTPPFWTALITIKHTELIDSVSRCPQSCPSLRHCCRSHHVNLTEATTCTCATCAWLHAPLHTPRNMAQPLKTVLRQQFLRSTQLLLRCKWHLITCQQKTCQQQHWHPTQPGDTPSFLRLHAAVGLTCAAAVDLVDGCQEGLA